MFDLGGVLIKWRSNDPIYRYLAERYDVPFGDMKRALIAGLPRMESGKISTEVFVQKSLSKVGRRVRAEDSGKELWLHEFARLAKLRMGVVRLVESLRNQGYSVYCLSNISAPHLEFIRTKGWTNLFDGFFASCELGCVKPNAEIFRRVIRAIGTTPDRVIFIDDTPICVDGARSFGIRRTVRFRSIPQLRRAVRAAEHFSRSRNKRVPLRA